MNALHALAPPAPAFLGGFPGGIELLVILLIAACVFGIPTLLLLGGGGYLFARSSRRDERLEELEREVDALRDRVGDDEDDGRDRAEDDGSDRDESERAPGDAPPRGDGR
ncbi:preprotein translocase subunit TatA [Halarchaeum nitratireducens]|uniref:Preprotein translocase subunit TatA n=1 Tax=Halarchaeum nitratireducens TaxID=489913 RepID=A0A830GC61_9EURY|nr:preprotein translocase subunit TatA [Halarchaeum nitratireducens]GGN14510.1 hypothetical protein GCM10009021_13490 [Halarchaeum nitratireducens]